MKVAWVHPSWRDLVIEHLRSDAVAREQFLRQTSVYGALLAISIAGGADGTRKLPLLVGDSDWDALNDRLFALLPDLGDIEQIALLDHLTAAFTGLDGDVQQVELRALAGSVLERVYRLAEASPSPIGLPLLEAWLALGTCVGLPPDVAALKRTWAELVPSASPPLDDPRALQRFVDWLTLADLLGRRCSQTLDDLGFQMQSRPIISGFLEQVDASIEFIPIYESNPLIAAVMLIETLHPTSTARRLAAVLRPDPNFADPPSVHLPDHVEEIAPDVFDIERVLSDL